MSFVVRSAAVAAVFAFMPVARAAVELQQQFAHVGVTVYAGAGALGYGSADGSKFQFDASRLAPRDLGSASLSASAQVNDQLTLAGTARYASTVGPDMLSMYSEFTFNQTRNVTSFSADMAAGVEVRAEGRMVFSVNEDTVVSLRSWRALSSQNSFVPQSPDVQSNYRLEQLIAVADGTNPSTGMPGVWTVAVIGLNDNGDTLLKAGNYMLSVNNQYTPAPWAYQVQAFDLLTGKMVTTTNPNTGFYGPLKGSSGITMSFAAAVPEPGTWALMALGLVGVASVASAKRRERRAPH